MRRMLLLSLFCCSLLAQDPAFRVSAKFVKVPVTVFDEQGRLLTNLTRENFELYDEGEERKIENFLSDKAPIHVLLLLDTSGSLRDEIKQIKDAALRFAECFDREDRIAIVSFSDKVVLLQDWTDSKRAIRKSVKRLETGYRTALYDALRETVAERFRHVSGRKVIIALTDGLDNQSHETQSSTLSELISSDITLYIVSRARLVLSQVRSSTRVEFLNRVMKNLLNDEGDFVDIYFEEKEASLRQLAESTGGRVLFPERLEDLGQTYVQVARELKQQYVLTFAPPEQSEERFRLITLTCDQPIGRIHYRRQYPWP